MRISSGIIPTYKMVDTCAAEFAAKTPYYYSTYDMQCELVPSDRKKVLILGSGPIRIGQGIEFDYCTVHAVMALREQGIEAHIVNNNPETVSTDYDTSDKLFFEPVTLEDVMNIIEKEQPYGVLVQFGGQTAINLAIPLEKEIARRGLELGVPYGLTWTCYEPRQGADQVWRHCGQCGSCQERKESFRDAGLPDPTEYAV